MPKFVDQICMPLTIEEVQAHRVKQVAENCCVCASSTRLITDINQCLRAEQELLTAERACKKYQTAQSPKGPRHYKSGRKSCQSVVPKHRMRNHNPALAREDCQFLCILGCMS